LRNDISSFKMLPAHSTTAADNTRQTRILLQKDGSSQAIWN
jgi:hypothetical protein